METTEIVKMIQDGGFICLLIILAVPKLRKKVFNGDGSKEIREQLTLMETNHLHSLDTKLDRLIEEEIKGNEEVRTLIRVMQNKI